MIETYTVNWANPSLFKEELERISKDNEILDIRFAEQGDEWKGALHTAFVFAKRRTE